MSAVKRIIVPFHGATAAVEELTWGQREIWTAMVNQRSWLPVFWIQTISAETSIDAVAARLSHCLAKHDSLRTRLAFGPDGEPRQVVADRGEVELEVYEAGARDPAEVAMEVRIRYCDRAYDFVTDWPVRPAVVVRDGQPTHLVLVLCHLVMDAMARDMLVRDLSGPDTTVDTGGMRPAQLAQWERGEPARQANAASMAHWERILRDVPARRFADPAGRCQPRYWEAQFSSRAMALALRVIAPKAAGATAPLLALFAVALARVAGSNPVVVQVVVSNRFRTHLAEVFAPVNQTGLWSVDVADVTMAEALSRSRRRAMSAYKNAYYDPRCRRDLVARVSAERGEEVDIGCFFNDRRMLAAMPDPDVPPPTAAGIHAARAETTFTWRTRTDQPSERLFVHVEDADQAIQLSVWVDTHCLSPADLEAVLREMEAVAITAAFDPMASTGVGVAADAPART